MEPEQSSATGWQSYASQVEAELDITTAENNKLKQDVRRLQRELIEPRPTDLNEQLAKAKQEIANNKQGYINHLNRLQQQLHNTEAAHTNTLSRLDTTTLELKDTKTEIQRLRSGVAENSQSLQQLRFSQPASSPTLGAVSLQDRCGMLERQLKLTQKENARLQQLSDRPRSEKPTDDEDDEEPEHSSDAAPTIKKEAKESKKAPRHVDLLGPADDRPENYTRGPPPPPTVSKAAPSKKTAAPSKAVTGYGAPAAVKRSGTFITTGTTAAMSIDLTADDDMGQPSRPTADMGVNTRLPVRTSIHDNITVAEPSNEKSMSQTVPVPAPAPAKDPITSSEPKPAPAKRLQPTPAAPKPTPAKPLQNTQPNPKPAPAATPPNTRKRGAPELLSNPTPKRRRSKIEELQIEAEELSIDAHGFDEPTQPRNKRRESYEESDCDDDKESDDAFEDSLDFRFTAVCGYDNKGDVAENYPSEDLTDCVAALWQRINIVQNNWEEASGEDWQWDFQKARKATAPVCVSQKCRRKATEWGAGRPAGKYTCVDCVRLGKPCFTFVKGGGENGGFRLLPLSAKDRTKIVTDGTETRYWINDGKVAGEKTQS